MRFPPPAIGLFLSFMPFMPPNPSQQGAVIDAGAFVITRGADVVGREEFTIRHGRTESGDGYTISATATYPPRRGQVTLAPVVELGPDSLPAAVQFDVFGDGQRRVYARFGARRVTVRSVRPGGEAAREFPAARRQLVVDDSVFALYAILPGRGEGPLHLIAPRQERRVEARLTDLGTERTVVSGAARMLRHFGLEAEGETRHLWFDEGGRLMKVTLPGPGLTAQRVEG